MVSASAFNIYFPLACAKPAFLAGVIPWVVSKMQFTPQALTSAYVLSVELLLTTIISTGLLVMLLQREASVGAIFSSSL